MEGTSYGTSTNDRGQFLIEKVPAGNYQLAISAVGYETKKQPVSVKAGEKTVVNYQINSQTSELSEVVVTTGRTQAFTSINKIEVPLRDIPLTTSAVSLKTMSNGA